MPKPHLHYTLKLYAYKGDHDLGKEPLGTSDKVIWRDLTTVRGAVERANKLFGRGNYRIYTFNNFYDHKTFKRVA